jgi:uncharacterized protein Usg
VDDVGAETGLFVDIHPTLRALWASARAVLLTKADPQLNTLWWLMLLIRRFEPKSIVTVQVLYFIPGYSLLNEFLWQTLDTRPRYPRVHSFLDYWRREIDAVIKEVTICDVGPR